MRKINLKNFQVATSLTARDINRRIILNVIRMRQPLSRADVARVTGLQRSTVSLIADQLIQEGWIVEGELGRLPRGRRPIYLQMNTDRAVIVGVNVRPGVTNVAICDLNGQFLDIEALNTGKDPKEFVKNLAQVIKNLAKRHKSKTIEGIGVSLPGRVHRETRKLLVAPNLGWKDVEIKAALQKATRLPVEVENAANACALAENYFGEHAEDIDNLAVVTVSEGIGTGIVVNGQLLRGATGLGGEFGHVVLESNQANGKPGTWENLASNRAALAYYAEGKSRKRGGKATPAQKVSSFNALVDLALKGDRRAVDALELAAEHLGRGIGLLVTGLEPSVIVVVGEITRAWNLVGSVIEEAAAAGTRHVGGKVRIVPSDDAAQPRLRGAIALVLEQHFGAPAVA